ncbi:hypothetical protein AEL97_11280, partial [Lactobacillus crispatus]
LTANIVESFICTQQKNSSSILFPQNLTVALNVTIQVLEYAILTDRKCVGFTYKGVKHGSNY